MANSLFDILKDKNFDEPAESIAIKKYVFDNFKEQVAVTVRERDIIIEAPSAALAGTLRMHQIQMKKAASTEKRLILRIR
ncbi:MAG: hypothetical protein ABIR37_01055 [Candidatus Saccharimonadales bacterium]